MTPKNKSIEKLKGKSSKGRDVKNIAPTSGQTVGMTNYKVKK